MVDYHTEILSSVLTKPTDDDDEDSDPLVDVEFFKLHGNMTQKERTEIFKTFSQANSGVLLCTVRHIFYIEDSVFFSNVYKYIVIKFSLLFCTLHRTDLLKYLEI
jgi:hypothetical protein